MKNVDVYVLSKLRWQFFGLLTFRSLEVNASLSVFGYQCSSR
jgi:hypothetical protein